MIDASENVGGGAKGSNDDEGEGKTGAGVVVTRSKFCHGVSEPPKPDLAGRLTSLDGVYTGPLGFGESEGRTIGDEVEVDGEGRIGRPADAGAGGVEAELWGIEGRRGVAAACACWISASEGARATGTGLQLPVEEPARLFAGDANVVDGGEIGVLPAGERFAVVALSFAIMLRRSSGVL